MVGKISEYLGLNNSFHEYAKIITIKGNEAMHDNIEEIRKLANRNSYILEFDQYIKKLRG